MRFGLSLALFTSLLGILSLVVRVPYGPQPVLGGIAPTSGAPPKCLRLRYDQGDSQYLPHEIRLRAERRFGQDLFAADGGPERFQLYNYSSWRPAGPDSLDIGWHHSPVIRIPTRGDSLVGRVAWSGAWPVWELVGLRDFLVVARPISCSTFVPPAS